MSSTVIILGSSRSDGNTAQMTTILAEKIGATIVDLNQYALMPYDYKFGNRQADFLPLVELLMGYDKWVFASPIYWFAPSCTLKVFMDRLCDLLEIYKNKGRQLAKKSAAVLATGAAISAADCFEPIFSRTFDYFNMNYLGMQYCSFDPLTNEEQRTREVTQFALKNFASSLEIAN